MEAAARERADYVICGRRLRVASNSARVIADFDSMYAGFRSEEGGAPDTTLLCNLSHGPNRCATFMAGDVTYRSMHPAILDNTVTVLRYLTTVHTRTHYFVHAGCVSRGGRAVVIAGHSGLGKTTLTTFLVSRGMAFMSDEHAAISRETGMVWPVPYRLGVRPGPAAELVEPLPGTPVEYGGDRKKLVDAAHVGTRAPQEGVPPRAFVFLTRRADGGVSTARKFGGLVRVAFTAMNCGFSRALLEETRSELVAEDDGCEGVFVRLLRTRAPDLFLDSLRRVSAEHGVAVVEIRHEDLSESDFGAEPQLVAIPPSMGIMELVKKMHPAQLSEIVRTEFAGRMPLMIEEVAGIVKGAAFYRLTPGRLERMVEGIESIA